LKLVLVDDNLLFRDDLKFFLENKLLHTVIAEATSGEEFLALENLCEADIILMDLTMETMDGFEATKKILCHFPHLKIIAITMNTENVVLSKLLETGFKGFIFKTEIFKSLEIVLQSVYSEGVIFSDKFHSIKN